ncbi:glycoside hydrolase family 65 protein [Enterobacter cloacae complex sp. P40RS]|uniref:Glycoside hydrolase family 65 protein n=1 Tax=Enterobacter pasteurii TaxID=3029761 RepID=A0ABR9QAW4_9ENTR|nr:MULTISPECIES: glycoside hydrolase family 65 protein [Enterobacter cloacae complex]MBE4855901.1 glycoside hydrolase family 65 protein [Enterobacter pasteurii]MBE4864966.1 glycoside hydrolase family 65 protein [Enterobacter cloacae complex sp. P40C2]MBE4876010.1 glycoside hydrolase family 65 protein [Enterobacter cloacae complex sp. P40C]
MLIQSVLTDPGFCPHSLNKYASIMACGNGYMGVRATHEEDYTQQTRGMYLAGLYHRAGRNETNELVNLPDITGINIELDGINFTLLSGEILDWHRELAFASGELRRSVLWCSPEGKRYRLESRRFVSLDQLPLVAMQLSITPVDADSRVVLKTGIDATQTNSGKQHLDEISVRVFDEHYMQGVYETQNRVSDVVISACCRLSKNSDSCFTAKNRRVMAHHALTVNEGDTVTFEKLVWVTHRSDKALSQDSFARHSLAELKACAERGYAALLKRSVSAWERVWLDCRVEVESSEHQDQMALDYAVWHLTTMTPAHSERSSIGAKGLTGEGYKGHVFWDTEIFLLPFHLFTRPQIARNLLRYRWLNLSGAREKARRNGWPGALFPWESAASGQEETPEFAAINIRTGVRQKVASALAEHHIVADIAWAVVAYWQATHDDAFMRNEGLTLLMETASFWMGRATETNGRLEIHDVIGPDEYTEHVNNNAYTNYLAWHNVACARQFMSMFGREDARFTDNAARFLARLWLPEANADGVIPQDDTFMAKPAIDLTRYKANAGKQTILLDYSRAEVNEMQILKQADVVMLNYLLPERFTPEQCAANLAFYEPRTIHDSSLSKAIHGIVLARCGDTEGAYAFWRDGIAIDLGDDPHSSDDGIHAAATGAIWSGAIQGFAGLQIIEGELHLAPTLPARWSRLAFPLRWRDATVHFTCEDGRLTIETTAPVRLTLWGKTLDITGRKVCAYKDFLASVNGTATTEGHHDA